MLPLQCLPIPRIMRMTDERSAQKYSSNRNGSSNDSNVVYTHNRAQNRNSSNKK